MQRRRMRSRRSITLAGGAIALTTVLLAGCAGGGGAETPSTDGGGLGTADEKIDLKILVNDAYASQWQEQLIPEFAKDYPNIDITIDGVPYNDQLAKTMLELTNTDATYDIVMADDNWTPQLASTGGLMDLRGDVLEQWTADDYDWDDFYPAALAAGEFDGTQYAVPARSNILMMLVNKSLYESAGVPLPTPDLTWDEYLEQAPDLVQDLDGDGKDDAWAVGTYFVRDGLTPTIWQTIMNSDGGQILNDDNTAGDLGDDAVEALEIHQKLLDVAPPGAVSWQFNEPLEAFRQGRLATLFTWGSVYRGSAVDPATTTLTPDQVGIQTLPAGSEGPGAHRGVWSMGVNSKTDVPEAAWTFVQWLTSKKGEQWQTNTLGVFPARASTLETTPEQEWLSPVYEALEVAWPAIEAGQMWRPHIVESDAVQQVLATETGEFIPGNITAEDAVKRMNDGIDDLLE
ncbi:sugar ABC transporter substrate-binding protein [Microbacterium sp. Se63.02b]|nr:sugar ABC transporter substrate-binding protein [Microbacterium sp. Se63.02b]